MDVNVMQENDSSENPLKQRFDELTQAKINLWNQIKDKDEYESTDQWKEIQALDQQLLELDQQIKGGK